MSQDILSLNKTTKSILKNPDPKTSLAYSNAILRKDPSKVNAEGIGLNPNVTLEDEYIQNLQKQIHFMDLEIKLMKEKQAQEEALGGNYQFAKIGLTDGKPSTDHIITTTSKLRQMKDNLTQQTNLLEQTLMKNREENAVHQAKAANLEKHVIDYDEKLAKVLHENSDALTQIRTKLLQEKRQREDVEMDIAKIKTQYDRILEDNERLRKETELRDLLQKIAQKRHDEDEHLDSESLAVKVKLIDELQVEKAKLFLVTEKDPRLQALREENEKLIKQVKESEKRLENTNYKALETETLQILSVKKKDEDQETRKKLQLEHEKWKDQLEETIRANELKVERKLREAESTIIKELQAELLKERHELNEMEQKFENIAEREKTYIIEQANRVRLRNDLIKKKEILEKKNAELKAEIELLDPQVSDIENVVEDLRLKSSDERENRAKLQDNLKKVEEENIVLESKFQFLQHNIKFEDDMKKFNIEELRRVIENNKNVNATIHDFMGKWDTLRQFSKMG